MFHLRHLILSGTLLTSGVIVNAQVAPTGGAQSGTHPIQKRALLSIFADYETVEPGAPFVPMTVKQKYMLFVKPSVDPIILPEAAALAAIQQAGDWAPNYGQGGKPYAQRFGAAVAGIATGNLFSNALFPALFRQDPRYFKKGSGGFRARFFYAVTRAVVTRQDSGKNGFNYSQICAIAASNAVSNLYYPSVNRTASQNASGFGYGIGVTALLNVVAEFVPGRKTH